MHWDYYTYKSQPEDFLLEVWAYMNVEARERKLATERRGTPPPNYGKTVIKRAPATRRG